MRHNGVGVVVGVIGPEGRRVVAHGRSGAKGVALDGDTEFLIGSVTKAFTTLLLADMVERGEVRLDDPAAKYLPAGVQMPQRGRPITLRDLATHVSGLPSMPTNFELDAEPDPYSAYTVEQLHAFLSTYVPERAPGERWAYSNLGVFLLGRLLANRAGTDYETLLRERVLEPLGLRDTAITLTPAQSRRLAPGHDRYLQPVRTWEMTVMQGSGSLRSTVDDLLTWVGAYLGYRDTPLKAAMTRPWTLRSPVRDSQALGWGISRIGEREIVGHRGGKEGYRSAVVFDPKTRTGVVVLANARTEDEPGDLAMHLLTGKPLPPAPPAPAPRKPATVSAELLSAYAGRYRLESGAVMTVAARGDYLAVETAPGDGISTFLPQSERELPGFTVTAGPRGPRLGWRGVPLLFRYFFFQRDFAAPRCGGAMSRAAILARISASSRRMGAGHFCRMAGTSRPWRITATTATNRLRRGPWSNAARFRYSSNVSLAAAGCSSA